MRGGGIGAGANGGGGIRQVEERVQEAFDLVSKASASRASEKVYAAGAHTRRNLSLGLGRLNARILFAHMDPQGHLC